MHKLLQRQLKKLDLSPSSAPDMASWQALIGMVNEGYDQMDRDRYLLERSLEISSQEMQALHQRLKETYEQRQNLILKAFPDLLFLFDEDGRYLEIMTPDEGSLIRPADELAGSTLSESLPSDIASLVMSAINRVLSTDKPQTIEYDLQVLSGLASFEGRMMPAGLNDDGKKTVLYLARDITEKKRNEQRQKLLNTVMNSATEGIVILRAGKQVLYANPSVEKITGYSENELLNEGEGFLRHELDQATCEDVCQAASSGDHFKRELVIHNKEGVTSDILLSMDTLRNEAGEIEYFVGILTDISAQREARQQIEHMATHDA